jgi:2-oxoisovalerate dehydrogenase E1 component alpha subunit
MTDKVLTVIEQDGKTAKAKEPQIDNAELQRIYRVMVMTRVMDEQAVLLQRQGGIGFYVPAFGQEATHVGAAYGLRDSDWIFPSYRDPGIMLLRQAPLDQIIAQWYGNTLDITKGRQMPVHYSFRSIFFASISSPIGTQISQATGAAMAARLRKDDTVVMTFFGDGATSSNDFHAGLNFAGVFKSPCIFVCENNQWAISAPLERQTGSETIASKAAAYGMPGVRVDGNDVLAVYRAAKEAADRARKGDGPTLIEAVTFRMGPHSSSDEPARYRDPKIVEAWADKDPIERFRRYLEKKKVWTEDFEKEVREGVRSEIKSSIKRVQDAPRPGLESMFEDVFQNLTSQLEEQLEDLRSLDGNSSEEEGAFPL